MTDLTSWNKESTMLTFFYSKMGRGQMVASVLVLASLWESAVDGKPDGVPEDACDSMNPAHGKAPQSYPCPFSMYPDKYDIRPNEDVVFTLEAPPGRAIRGFMVQARVDINTVIGQFFANISKDVKVIDCCEAKQVLSLIHI